MTNIVDDINEAVYGQPQPEYSTEEIIERALVELFDGNPDEYSEAVESEIVSFRTFEDAGILTMDRGVVVTALDGSEYHVIIARSR